MVWIIDYAAGNLRSVQRALSRLGIDWTMASKPEDLVGADRVLFPGVGHAASAMAHLNQTGMAGAIKQFVQTGNPFMGICLGSQIILEQSEEGPCATLGILPGTVRYFEALLGPLEHNSESLDPQRLDNKLSRLGGYTINGQRLKIPHMGWNRVRPEMANPAAKVLFNGISPDASFYFVHSYYTQEAVGSDVLCRTEYGRGFSSGLSRGNVVSFQFHPEKSGPSGLLMLENFMNWRP